LTLKTNWHCSLTVKYLLSWSSHLCSISMFLATGKM